jgi:molecular chaperone GrpE
MVHPVFWTEPWYSGARPPRMVPVYGPEPSVPDVAPAAHAESRGSPVAATLTRSMADGPTLEPGARTPASDASAVRTEPERWREALRELEAARARAVREGERAAQAARAELVGRLLPVLDGLDRSLAAGATTNGLLDGVKLVRAQLAQVLSDFGVERIDAVGQLFDPQQHEAVDVVAVDSPTEHHRVADEWEAGYRHAGRVLRPAKVRVGKFSR